LNKCEGITKNTRKIIDDYIQAGGVWDEWLAYMNCKIMKYEEKDAFTEALHVMNQYPNIRMAVIPGLMNLTHALINTNDQEMITTYRKALTNFALRQNPEEKRFGTVGIILAEREKWPQIIEK